ncbi:hypothetical protein LY78DRAFT_640388 [Colletotrichum sublineola]|nr:hypothetical protein LY78DRAFT_640388 [Colletotrichum sublineola]
MNADYSYPVPAGFEAESTPTPAPAHPTPAPFLPTYSDAGHDGGEGQGGGEQFAEVPMNAGENIPSDFSKDDFWARIEREIEWAGSAPSHLVFAPTVGSTAFLSAPLAPMAEPGSSVPLGVGQVPDRPPAVGPSPGVGQFPVSSLAPAVPALPGYPAPVGNLAAGVGTIAPNAHTAPVAPSSLVAPPPLLPHGFRIQDNHVLRHDWPQGPLQPPRKHLKYERSKNPKPPHDNTIWCNSCERWLWTPCYERVPLKERDGASCCNRCHWRKRANGMEQHAWMLAAQPRMMHLLKKDAGYAA